MLNMEELLKIDELKLPDDIQDIDKYILTLTAFIESFPTYETKLKETFETRNYESFSTVLAIVKDLLVKIHADGLVQSCEKLLSDVKDLKREEIVEAYLNYFLTAISSLSIDIQMAEYSAENKTSETGNSQDEINRADAQGVKTILAVDDSPVMIEWIKSSLKDTDYKFTGVISGANALKFIEKRRPDLFVLDIEMPEMDGYELARRIRENGHTAPIIFLTGNSSKEHVLKALQSGAVDFIVKPINIENMLEKIQKYIG